MNQNQEAEQLKAHISNHIHLIYLCQYSVFGFDGLAFVFLAILIYKSVGVYSATGICFWLLFASAISSLAFVVGNLA